VRLFYDEIRASREFDAAVLAKNERGEVTIEKSHEDVIRHDVRKGLAWGLAAGLAAALFPAVGIWGALITGGAGGAAIGAIAGLQELCDAVDQGQAALIVVYRANVADQVSAIIKAENRHVSQVTNATANQIAKELSKGEAGLD
jgi:hypothetical protein